jgi:hypothetical protein
MEGKPEMRRRQRDGVKDREMEGKVKRWRRRQREEWEDREMDEKAESWR